MRKRSLSSSLAAVLNVGWYGIAITLAVTLCLVVVGANIGLHLGPGGPNVETGPNVTMRIPVEFEVDANVVHIAAPALGIDDARVQDLRGSLKFPARKGAFFVANMVLFIGALVLALWVLSQLRALFRALRDGQAFVPANATRVRRIAWAVICGECARSAVVFGENYYAMTHFAGSGLTFSAWPRLNVFAVVNGLIILAIAEVFREGTRLDEDQSLTI